MKIFSYVFKPEQNKYKGIRPINIYAMRIVYILMAIFLGKDVWGHIFTYDKTWDPSDAMDWSVWGAFSLFALLGVFRTVQMIPILLLEIVYKVIWLFLVALPLWQAGNLSGETTDGMIFPFVLVVLPIIAMPWGYVFKQYIMNKPHSTQKA
ncbi:hypothetical protein [Pleionea mediterranea]|uniref:DoxX-like protein n=1 Tax=Pleionea mediterranea TaxID=523701 RepID=A0A316FXC6_9GAMM|nr:hypothetical protein [Pleionea mediterranea]PWK53229.1 hypothetical protein C8D97_10352 [Pleionea mediterranea]